MNIQFGSVTDRIASVLLAILGSLALFSASFVMPPLGFITLLIAPFPIVFYYLRNGRMVALLSLIAVAITLAATFSPNIALFYLLQCGVIAIVMPWLLLKDYTAAGSIAWTSIINSTLLAISVVVFSVVSGNDPQKIALKEISESVSQAIAFYEKSGVKAEDLDILKKSMAVAAELVARIYPALMAIMLTLTAGINMFLIRIFATRTKRSIRFGTFKTFRLPEHLVWLLILSGSGMLINNPVVTTPALNVLLVLLMLYFLQGLAVMLSTFARYPFANVARIFLCLMLFMQPYLAGLVAAIGIFDLWGDFRTPKKQENL